MRRLFEDYQSVERDYYLKTKIFPIMHVVVIRRDVYEKHRWVAQSLCKAFALAQRDTYEDLHEMGALKSMLPWLVQHVEDTEKLMGRDFWPYGLEPNIHVLANLPPLFPRARSGEAAARAGRAVRPRIARVV